MLSYRFRILTIVLGVGGICFVGWFFVVNQPPCDSKSKIVLQDRGIDMKSINLQRISLNNLSLLKRLASVEIERGIVRRNIIFSPDGSTVVFSSEGPRSKVDYRACTDIWSLNLFSDTLHVIQVPEGTYGTSEMTFNSDGSLLLLGRQLCAGRNCFSLWDANSGQFISSFEYAEFVQLPDQEILSYREPNDDQNRFWWSVEEARNIDDLPGLPLRDVRLFASDGKRFVTTSADAIVYLWDLSLKQKLLELPSEDLRGLVEDIPMLEFSPDGRWLAAYGRDVRVWNTITGDLQILDEIKHFNWYGLAGEISSDSSFFGFNHNVWNIQSGQIQLSLGEDAFGGFGPDGGFFISVSDEGLRFIDTEETSELFVLPVSGGLRALNFNPEGKLFAFVTNSSTQPQRGHIEFWGIPSS